MSRPIRVEGGPVCEVDQGRQSREWERLLKAGPRQPPDDSLDDPVGEPPEQRVDLDAEVVLLVPESR